MGEGGEVTRMRTRDVEEERSRMRRYKDEKIKGGFLKEPGSKSDISCENHGKRSLVV
jgi:hypothetical protein